MTPQDQPDTPGASPQLAWGVAGVAGLLAFLSLVFVLRPEPPEQPPQVLRAAISPPSGFQFGRQGIASSSEVSVSPDGRSIAFVAGDQLWLRPLSEATPVPILGTVGARLPFWSPDSTTVGFFADSQLKAVRATGGEVRAICDAPLGQGGSWGADGTILFSPDQRTGIYRVAAAGGEPEPLTEVDSALHSTHRWPEFIPGGDRFLFLAASHANPRGAKNGIYVASIKGGSPHWITAADSQAVLSAGRLLFMRQGDLMAQPFDLIGLEVAGQAVRLTRGVRYRGGSWFGMFSGSNRDVLVYETGSRDLRSRLTWVDRLGNEQGTMGEGDLHWDLQFSPQGDRLAVAQGSPEPELWIYEPESGGRNRLMLEPTFNRAPVWSPDGERLAFAAMTEHGRLGIFVVDSRGTGEAELLLDSELDQVPTSWSPDGELLVFDQGPPGATEIWAVPMTGEGPSRPVVQIPPWVGDGHFSPDGKWLLYTSRESGADQVYLTLFSDPGDRWQLSTSSWGSHGRWSLTGDRVYFGSSQAMLMEVEVRARKGGGVDLGMPKMLFSFRPDDSVFRGHNGFYDVVGEDERYLLAQGPEREPDRGLIMLVVPWFAELEEGN